MEAQFASATDEFVAPSPSTRKLASKLSLKRCPDSLPGSERHEKLEQYSSLSSQIEEMAECVRNRFQVQEQMLQTLTHSIDRYHDYLSTLRQTSASCLYSSGDGEAVHDRADVDQQIENTEGLADDHLSEQVKHGKEVCTVLNAFRTIQAYSVEHGTSGGEASNAGGAPHKSRLELLQEQHSSQNEAASAHHFDGTANEDDKLDQQHDGKAWPQIRSSLRSSQRSLRVSLRKVVTGSAFMAAIGCVDIISAITTFVQVQGAWDWRQDQIPTLFSDLDKLFAAVYTLEVAVVLFALGCHEYFCGVGRYRYWFDFSVTVAAASDIVFSAILDGETSAIDGDTVRMLRLLRLARVARGMKLVGFVRALRDLVAAIISTLGSLLWASLLLFLIYLFFALGLSQIIVDYCRVEAVRESGDLNALPSCSDPALLTYWKNVPESILTLFMFNTGGIDWRDALLPLRQVSWLATSMVVVFIIITDLAVLNVFVGVFCESAIQSAASTRETEVEEFLKDKHALIDSVKLVFERMAENHDVEEITLDMFEAGLQDVRLQALLATFHIPTHDAWMLFSLLDVDQSGRLNITEFIDGCLHLRGYAKTIHIASLVQTGQRRDSILSSLQEQMSSLDRHIRSLHPPGHWNTLPQQKL